MVSWFLILAIFSGGGIIVLLFIRFLSVKDLSKQELYNGIVFSRPFFSDFNRYLKPVMRISVKIYSVIFSRKEFVALKKHYCNFSDYMRGRHLVEKNGCEGYWGEVNDYKNKKNSKENSDLPR